MSALKMYRTKTIRLVHRSQKALLLTRETPALGGISLATGGAALIKKKFGAPAAPQISGAPNGFKNFTCAMRILNMCLVVKLDNGNVASIADEQTHPVYRLLLFVSQPRSTGSRLFMLRIKTLAISIILMLIISTLLVISIFVILLNVTMFFLI